MKFYSKAKTLNILRNFKHLNVPETFICEVGQFKKNPELIIKKIQKKFFNKKIAIRSSSINEDTETESMAGKFKSFLNIKSKNKISIKNKIIEVIKSYKSNNSKNEILIQNMVQNIKISGVINTRDKNTNSPYNKIEYSKSSKSDQITSGKNIVKSFTYFKFGNFKFKNKDFKKCDDLIKFLESIYKSPLDIEFAISKSNKIHLLQVRPLIIKQKVKVSDEFFKTNLKKVYKKISKLQIKHYNLHGKKSMFGVMPDWNPAEMIGIKPKKLSLSLYEELITNDIWSKQRKSLGYKDLTSHHLLTNFLGTPYVDIRVDFNSWIPNTLTQSTSEKLVNFYLNKFRKNLFLHDKIEFNIIFTCLTFNLDDKLNKLTSKNFSKQEIKEIKDGLRIITNNTIRSFDSAKNNLAILEKKNKLVNNSSLYVIDKIYWLIEDCKRYGTFTFAGAARCGFIAVEILESMVIKKIITADEKNKFLNSIETISSIISKDYYMLTKKKFILKHGHLRPNMYDIVSKNYRDGYNQYFSKKDKMHQSTSNKKFIFSQVQISQINKYLKKNKFNINANQLITFIRDAIEYREYTKYVFSKNVSDVLEYIKKLFDKNQIDLELAPYISIQTIKNFYYNLSTENVKRTLEKEIAKNKTEYKNNQLFKLPDNIISNSDSYYFYNQLVKSNFITNKKTIGKIYNFNLKTIEKMRDKIVFIENADPGYDFIFTKKIKGLVTKYGGANSHMAIRCAELGIPAAIGVGEDNFDKYIKNSLIQLDCESNLIRAHNI